MTPNTLPQEISVVYTALRSQAAVAWKQDDFATVEKLLAEAWNLIPEPKAAHKFESQATLNTRIKCLIKLRQGRQAKALLNDLRDLYEPPADNAHVSLTSGIVCYESGDFDEAFKWFDQIYKQFKTRAFQGADEKYLKFYRQGLKL